MQLKDDVAVAARHGRTVDTPTLMYHSPSHENLWMIGTSRESMPRSGDGPFAVDVLAEPQRTSGMSRAREKQPKQAAAEGSHVASEHCSKMFDCLGRHACVWAETVTVQQTQTGVKSLT